MKKASPANPDRCLIYRLSFVQCKIFVASLSFLVQSAHMQTTNTPKAGERTQNTKCSKDHSGNHHLTKMGRGRLALYWQCDGCGQIYTASQLGK